MTRYEILIKDNYGNGEKHYLDTYDTDPLKLTYSVADIRDISKRNSSHSKTVKLPGTPANNKIFSFIFDVNVDIDGTATYNPKKRADCAVMVDTVPVIEGFFQLTDINILDSGEIQYEGVIYGELVDIMKSVGDKLLTGNEDSTDDLDMSAFNHTLDKPNVEASWSGDADLGYIYPQIDYGYGFNSATLNASQKLVPFMNLFPCTYLKNIVDKIFSKAGFTYTSEFFDSDYFKKIFWATTKPGETDDRVKAVRTTDYTVTQGNNVMEFNSDTGDGFDLYNEYFGSPLGYQSFNPSTSGLYDIKLTVWGVVTAGSIKFELSHLTNPGGGYTHATNPDRTFTPSITTLGTEDNPSVFIIRRQLINTSNFYYHVRAIASAGVSATIAAGATVEFSLVPNTVDMNQALPDDVKQADVLTSVFKMFNLYVEPDKDNVKNLIIEPRDDYYGGGVLRDWRSKLDRSGDYKMSILSELGAKKYVFTYKQDKDALNEDYADRVGEVYGEFEYEVDNDFITGETKVEPIFSPTPSQSIGGYSNVVMPRIFKQNNNGRHEGIDFNHRLLMNFGTVPILNGGTLKMTIAGTDHTFTTYNYTGMYEIPEITGTPIAEAGSILFGNIEPLDKFDNGNLQTNLFDRFYSNAMSAITSPNAKMLRAKFYLTELDIYKMRFNDLIYLEVEGSPSYWRLNRVIDFDASAPGLTDVELIKADEIASTPVTTKVRGRVYDNIDIRRPGTDTAGIVNGIDRGGNHNHGEHNVVIGRDNGVAVGSDYVLVVGQNNVVGKDSPGAVIIGDNNRIPDNLVRVKVFGSGMVATASDTSYFAAISATSATVGGLPVLTSATPLGSMAFQNATAVAITGGTATLSSLTVNGPINVGGNSVAAAGMAKHITIAPTLTATANSNKLISLYLDSTFVSGGFSSVENYAIYQNSTSASNFFAGPIKVGTVTNPTEYRESYILPGTPSRAFSLRTSEQFYITDRNNSSPNTIAVFSVNGIEFFGGTSAPSGGQSYKMKFAGSFSAVTNIGRYLQMSPTLVASANNDVLSALYINPTFTNGAFTGVTNYGIYSAAGENRFIENVRIGSTAYGSSSSRLSITSLVNANTLAIVVYTSAGSDVFQLYNTGLGVFTSNGSSNATTIGNNAVYSANGINIRSDVTGSSPDLTVGTTTAANTVASGSSKKMFIVQQDITYSTTSSKVVTYAEITGIVNQSAGVATGIVYGLRINNTLTAAADYRAVQIDNNSHWAIYQSGASAKTYLAGTVLIGTTTNTNNSKLLVSGSVEITGTSSVFIPPKLTTAQRNALTPIVGMVIYNTDNDVLESRGVTGWVSVGDGCCYEHNQIAISGTQDGSNNIFTIAQAPNPGTHQLFRNGVLLTDGGTDYTLAGTTITFTIPPAGADVLRFFGTV